MPATTWYDPAGSPKRPDFPPAQRPTPARQDAPFRGQGRRRFETGGGTDHTSWGRSLIQWILANGKTPPAPPPSENLNRYVEDFDEPRTLHGKKRVSARWRWAGEKGDFFSSLPRLVESIRQAGDMHLKLAPRHIVDIAAQSILDHGESDLVPGNC
jgi:hypothetical protein